MKGIIVDNIFNKTKQITSLLRDTTVDFDKEFPYNPFIGRVAAIMECNMCLFDTKGKFLGYYYSDTSFYGGNLLKKFFVHQKFSETILKAALMIYEVESDESFEKSILHDSKAFAENYSHSFVTTAPIYGNDLRLGTVIVWSDNAFTLEQLTLLEVFSTIVGIQFASSMLEKLENQRRDATLMNLVQSLSRTELEAFRTIIEKIDI